MIFLVIKKEIIGYYSTKEDALHFATEMNNREKATNNSFLRQPYYVMEVEKGEKVPKQYYEVLISVYKSSNKIGEPMFILKNGESNPKFLEKIECLNVFEYKFHLDIIEGEDTFNLNQRALEKFSELLPPNAKGV